MPDEKSISTNAESTPNDAIHEPDERLIVLYEENARIARHFLDWRHRIMTFCFTVTGAVLVAAGWLYQRPEVKRWLFIPFVVGAIFSAIAARLDRRNFQILSKCYRIGDELEKKFIGKKGIFSFINKSNGITYTKVLRIVYYGLAIVFSMLAVLSAVFYAFEQCGCRT